MPKNKIHLSFSTKKEAGRRGNNRKISTYRHWCVAHTAAHRVGRTVGRAVAACESCGSVRGNGRPQRLRTHHFIGRVHPAVSCQCLSGGGLTGRIFRKARGALQKGGGLDLPRSFSLSLSLPFESEERAGDVCVYRGRRGVRVSQRGRVSCFGVSGERVRVRIFV